MDGVIQTYGIIMFSSNRDLNDDRSEVIVNESSVPFDFPMFLTLFIEVLRGTDPEVMIENVFRYLNENDESRIHVDLTRELLDATETSLQTNRHV